MIALLNDDEPTVREWAAIALANLEIDGSCSAAPSPTQEWRVRPKQMSAGKALFLR
ncbi:HEAT repeat domain-containing protein [Streptomyces sp. NBC_01589]|uniref:HEAT repeat domain-containing protein n=1 Tax=unclassified Streptomyces TaxID=2593676 RepID=UPI0038648ECA